MHWATRYIGLRYVEGGRSMAGVDCWGLLRLVYANEFGIDLEPLPGITAQSVLMIHTTMQESAERSWERIEAPVDGCGVAMSQQNAIHHVGVWIDAAGGMVLHSWEKQNVIADTFMGLRFKGIRKIIYYKHRLWTPKQHSPTPEQVGFSLPLTVLSPCK